MGAPYVFHGELGNYPNKISLGLENFEAKEAFVNNVVLTPKNSVGHGATSNHPSPH